MLIPFENPIPPDRVISREVENRPEIKCWFDAERISDTRRPSESVMKCEKDFDPDSERATDWAAKVEIERCTDWEHRLEK
jgi:hypothetical protein